MAHYNYIPHLAVADTPSLGRFRERLLPPWYDEDNPDVGSLSAYCTIRAAQLIFWRVRRWRLSGNVHFVPDSSYTGTYAFSWDGTFSGTFDASSSPDLPTPADERQLYQIAWLGQSEVPLGIKTSGTFGMTDQQGTSGTGGLSINFFNACSWMRVPARANHWTEYELKMYFYFTLAGPAFQKDGMPDPPGPGSASGSPNILGFATWQPGAPGASFYATIYNSHEGSYVNATLEPAQYWGWDGRFNTVTGARL